MTNEGMKEVALKGSYMMVGDMRPRSLPDFSMPRDPLWRLPLAKKYLWLNNYFLCESAVSFSKGAEVGGWRVYL